MFSKLVTKRYTQNIAFRSFSKVDSRGTPSIFSDIDKHGFLPSQKPMITLPSEFKALNEALDAMRFLQNGQETGLLAKNELRKQIDANFQNLIFCPSPICGSATCKGISKAFPGFIF